jgi:hypothetical protein
VLCWNFAHAEKLLCVYRKKWRWLLGVQMMRNLTIVCSFNAASYIEYFMTMSAEKAGVR